MTSVSHFLTSGLLAACLCTSLSAQNPPAGFTYETLSDGSLQEATAMAWTPDGRLLITERQTGNIRVFRDGQLDPNPWASLSVFSGGAFTEAGLLGIAVDPAFVENGYVYVYYNPGFGECAIARLQDSGGVGTNLTVLTTPGAIPGQNYHNGGAMVFGHDGKLYVATGDALGPGNAQNLSSWAGKVLRFDVPNLTFPQSNPYTNSPVFSYGHRNHFGLAVHPGTSALYQTENGGALQDELNLIEAGGNYGWPMVEGNETTPNPAWNDPKLWWSPTTAPTGCCFYSGEHYPASYYKALFYTDYNWGRVHMISFDVTGNNVIGESVFDQANGACYGITSGPDGNLWLLRNDNGGYGADEIGRYVHANESTHSLQLSSVSNKTLGASLTMCVRSENGNAAVAWLSLSRLSTPIPTPWGNAWVPLDAPMPTMLITNDDRAYMPLEVPNVPTFLGSSFHGQAVVLDAAGQLRLTNPSELITRG